MTFGPTLITVKNQLISADFNQPIFIFPSDLVILDQNYNMGHFSHSILVTEPNSVIRIEKFQQFWNFLESMESLDKYHNFVCFGQMGYFFHSKLSPGFDSAIKIKKFQKLWNSHNSSGIIYEFSRN